jgi:phosphatidate cytidylyltransferase
MLPCSLVIVNDSFAYISGKLFGRTKLIALSPNKTWEGFFGGLICTIVWAYFFTDLLSRFDHFLCPQDEITLMPF